jgi:hypothetical protein
LNWNIEIQNQSPCVDLYCLLYFFEEYNPSCP